MKHFLLLFALLNLFVSVGTCQKHDYREFIRLAEEAYQNKKFTRSGEYYNKALAAQEGTPSDYYNAACSWAMAGKKHAALDYLKKSIGLGWMNLNHLKKDADLSSLHEEKEWEIIVNSLEKKVDAYESHFNKLLMQELEVIYESDQEHRIKLDFVQSTYGWESKEMRELWAAKQNQVDSLNLTKIKRIITQYGYPGKSLVGSQSFTAWLVIQHADLETQEEYLPILEDAANKGELPKSNFALLVDRVKMGRGEKQVYGSQIQMKDGKYVIYPIEDEPNVNRRRAEMGLGSLESYIKRWGIEYKLPAETEKSH